MKKTAIAAMTTAFLVAPAFAEGDAEAGENVWKKCRSCHMIVSDDGTEVQKGGKTGPNLYAISGRVVGSVEGYKYGKSTMALGETGAVWSEEEFVAYVADPRKYLQEALDDPKAKSKMSFKLKDAEDAANLWAYLVSVAPAS